MLYNETLRAISAITLAERRFVCSQKACATEPPPPGRAVVVQFIIASKLYIVTYIYWDFIQGINTPQEVEPPLQNRISLWLIELFAKCKEDCSEHKGKNIKGNK